ncbi:MAG TPA: phosphomannomutase/phosphoglucomutase, partial [Candidatus Diapherotrites archaeon]|nr:phosphomannomutase/phosphoglucomutase [Candidatus Diapherotrites archaeon]
MAVRLNPYIFREYDIRGLVGKDLTPEGAEVLGKAFGTYIQGLSGKRICVGGDNRESTAELKPAFIRGLRDTGCQATNIGLSLSPMMYFAVCYYGFDGGVNVTGSHNPKDYNGFKMVLNGRAIFGEDIQGLRRRMENGDLPTRAGGAVRTLDVGDTYRDRIVGDVKLARPIKIVMDCGNGVAGASAPALFRALGCEVIELFSEVDGEFPNHHPDPSKPENLRWLIEALQGSDAELGLAFDGDGDRLGVVTKDGEIIFPDRQLMLFAAD